VFLWGTFTVCSAVSAIGFASANRTFTVDSRKVQAALNQSRLASLEADQSELRRLRERLAAPDVARSERLRLATAVQRLEAAIGATRGKLEDAAPIVTTPNPQAYTLAHLTGASMDRVETGLVLLVALLVELGGLGPFITMSLARAHGSTMVPEKVPTVPGGRPQPEQTPASVVTPLEGIARTSPTGAQCPQLIYSAVRHENLESDLRRFLNLQTRLLEGSTLGSTDLLARYNGSRCKRGEAEITQRRFGDAMNALGHRKKLRLSGGRIHYHGLTWTEPRPRLVA